MKNFIVNNRSGIGKKRVKVPSDTIDNIYETKLRELIRKQIKLVKEADKRKITEGTDFIVSVHYQNDTPIQKGSFTLKSDAMLYIKDMIKKHKLKRGKGFWYNMKNAVEMTTNF